ncbi:hypothetical protein TNIN_413011 [Trichonephila inaurata madagascariensis]|uniref:Uncharacterized protein n=1 Tax=Trichonephila inaurata madagascariensis TaxID=2747483 RepID=A0A8X6YPN5_9ARAC|nr:hypothetical protein TNIN_413011 [Trichonephila inaurata madagascariensis]
MSGRKKKKELKLGFNFAAEILQYLVFPREKMRGCVGYRDSDDGCHGNNYGLIFSRISDSLRCQEFRNQNFVSGGINFEKECHFYLCTFPG